MTDFDEEECEDCGKIFTVRCECEDDDCEKHEDEYTCDECLQKAQTISEVWNTQAGKVIRKAIELAEIEAPSWSSGIMGINSLRRNTDAKAGFTFTAGHAKTLVRWIKPPPHTVLTVSAVGEDSILVVKEKPGYHSETSWASYQMARGTYHGTELFTLKVQAAGVDATARSLLDRIVMFCIAESQ